MKLRAKIILAFGLTVLGMVALAHWVSQDTVMRGFVEVETRVMQAQLTHLAQELSQKSERLHRKAKELARSREIQELTMAQDSTAERGEMAADLVSAFDVQIVLLLDENGALRCGNFIDWRTQQAEQVSPEMIRKITGETELLVQESTRPKFGFMYLQECPLMIAAAPVATPADGKSCTLILGKWLDPRAVSVMGKQMGVDWLLLPRSPEGTQIKVDSGELWTPDTRMVIENNERFHQTGYMTLPDINGKPTLISRIQTPRLIYLQGLASQRYTIASLLLSGAVCTFAVWFAVYWFIIRRLEKIQQAVVTVGTTQQLGQRVELDGCDELAELAQAINSTLEAVRSTEKARREVDERLHHIVGSIDDVVWSMDPQADSVLYVSPSVLSLFGVRHSAALEGRGPWQMLVVPEDADRVYQAFERLRRSGVLDIQYRVQCPDGQFRHIHNRARMIWDEFGTALRIDGICTDITESQRLSDELRRAHQQIVNDAHRAGKAEIATSVLHNVGNALNGVNVSTSVLHTMLRKSIVHDFKRVLNLLVEQSGKIADYVMSDPRGQNIPGFIRLALPLLEDEREHLGREVAELHSKVEHIQRIIQAQQENARSMMLVEETDLQNIVTESLRICGNRATTHGVEMELKLDFNPRLRVAKSQISQVLVNLINNAIDAVKPEVVKQKRIVITSGSEDGVAGQIVLSVADSGMGIAPEHLTRIFSHGFTTKADGHGFGLHYCALAMTSIGGSIHAASAGLGHGTIFTLKFPAEHPSEHNAKTRANPRPKPVTADDLQPELQSPITLTGLTAEANNGFAAQM